MSACATENLCKSEANSQELLVPPPWALGIEPFGVSGTVILLAGLSSCWPSFFFTVYFYSKLVGRKYLISILCSKLIRHAFYTPLPLELSYVTLDRKHREALETLSQLCAVNLH